MPLYSLFVLIKNKNVNNNETNKVPSGTESNWNPYSSGFPDFQSPSLISVPQQPRVNSFFMREDVQQTYLAQVDIR